MLKRFLLTLALGVALSACDGVNDEMKSLESIGKKGPTVWVFAQINVPQDDGAFEDYYYFGRVQADQYAQIKENKLARGFLLLSDVHYWDNDDRIRAYRDEVDSGELVFRVEDVRMLTLQRKAPIVGDDVDKHEGREPKKDANVEKDA